MDKYNFFIKYIFKSIKTNFRKYISFMFVVILGTGAAIGLDSSGPRLMSSSETYFKNFKLQDMTITSPYGFTDEDVEEIKGKLKNSTVDKVRYDEKKDIKNNTNLLVFEDIYENKSLNIVEVESGELPKKNDEIALDFILKNKYKIGDIIEFKKDGVSKNKVPSLENERFKVVGFIKSPEYFLGLDRGNSPLGNSVINGIALTTKGSMSGTMNNSIVIKFHDLNNLDTYSFLYEDKLKEKSVEVNNIIKSLTSSPDSEFLFELMPRDNKIDEKNNRNLFSNILSGISSLSKIDRFKITTRNNLMGVKLFSNFSKQMKVLALFFGGMFFLVAMLICYTVISRLLVEERTSIGVLRALGYSKLSIHLKYVLITSFVAIVGTIVGAFLGLNTIPKVIFSIVINLNFKELSKDVNWFFIIIMVIAFLLLSMIISIISIRKLLANSNASILRPQAPKSGKKSKIENLPFFKNMDYLRKVSFRNILRFKGRSILMIISISICTALIITGFGIKDSILSSLNNQFEKVYNFDLSIYLKSEENNPSLLKEEILNDENVKSVMVFYTQKVEIENSTNIKSSDSNDEKLQSNLKVIDSNENISDFYKWEDYSSNKELTLIDDGVLIDVKTSELLNLKVGEQLILNIGNEKIPTKIGGIFKNHVGFEILMSDKYYNSLFNNSPIKNSGVIKFIDGADDEKRVISEDKIKKLDGIISVVDMKEIKNNSLKNLKSINLISYFLTLISLILVTAVVFCLLNISFDERIKELATIRVLGMTYKEALVYYFREVFILSTVASLIGVFLGNRMTTLLMKLIEEKEMFYIPKVEPLNLIISFIIIEIFVATITLPFLQRIKSINMVESLKGIE